MSEEDRLYKGRPLAYTGSIRAEYRVVLDSAVLSEARRYNEDISQQTLDDDDAFVTALLGAQISAWLRETLPRELEGAGVTSCRVTRSTATAKPKTARPRA